MKKQSLIYLVLALFILSCASETIEGSGILVSESRDVPFFNSVSSEGVFEVHITQGTQQSIEVTADNNIISHLKTRVVNNELQIYLDHKTNYKRPTVDITIVTTGLNGLKNSGTGNIYTSHVTENGAFSIYNTGTGSIHIEGTASSLNLFNEGSGSVFAFDFQVDNGHVEIVGSGDVELFCSNTLDVVIEGSGNVYYKGLPSINVSITGSGVVIDDN